MSRLRQPQGAWQPCPAGALPQFARRERGRQRRRAILKWGGTAGIVAVLTTAGFFASIPHDAGEPDVGGITCAEVQRHASDYLAGRLDEVLAARILTHLKHCRECRSEMEMLRQKGPAVSLVGPAHHSRCSCAAGSSHLHAFLDAAGGPILGWSPVAIH